jgi:hypothetical protein
MKPLNIYRDAAFLLRVYRLLMAQDPWAEVPAYRQAPNLAWYGRVGAATDFLVPLERLSALRSVPYALLSSGQDHTFLRIQEKVEFLPLLLFDVIGGLNSHHGVVDINKEVEKIAQVGAVHDGPLK